ncbi:MAG: RNA polymerase sigma factor [Pseudomonadota bacterium]
MEVQPAHNFGEVIVLADSEATLIALVRQRHQIAFKRLYDKYLPMVYGLCLRMTGSVSMAEEATQEVFIMVWRKIDTFAGDSTFKTWLHSLTTNTTLTYLRKQKSWLKRMIGSDDYEEMAEGLEASPPTEIDDLQYWLNRLPERARLVFVLHAIEGYRQENVAKAMGISVGTVKAQFHRARNLLQTWMGEADEVKPQ